MMGAMKPDCVLLLRRCRNGCRIIPENHDIRPVPKRRIALPAL